MAHSKNYNEHLYVSKNIVTKYRKPKFLGILRVFKLKKTQNKNKNVYIYVCVCVEEM